MFSRRSALGAAACAFVLALAAPATSAAQEPASDGASRIAWDPSWRRFDLTDWIITGAGGAAAIAGQIIPPSSSHATGGLLFDDGVREALRPSSRVGRIYARDASDLLLTINVAYPFLIDSLAVTSNHYHANDLAWQMALMDGEALALTAGVQGLVSSLSNRERPFGKTCGTQDLSNDTADCQNNTRYRSFFSGHSSLSFTSAGLTCAHHLKLELYGGGVADVTACVAGLLSAGATATLRVVGDVHYASDVLVGSMVGLASGLSVPLLLHYGPARRSGERAPAKVDFSVVPMGMGVGVSGRF